MVCHPLGKGLEPGAKASVLSPRRRFFFPFFQFPPASISKVVFINQKRLFFLARAFAFGGVRVWNGRFGRVEKILFLG